MEKKHTINELVDTTMEKVRAMADVNTLMGQPIQVGDVTIIPVSRLTFGFAGGGSDFTTKTQKPEHYTTCHYVITCLCNLLSTALLKAQAITLVPGSKSHRMPVLPGSLRVCFPDDVYFLPNS